MYRIPKNVAADNYKNKMLSSGRPIDQKRIDRFPTKDKLEPIAMAHYKYLGHTLKRELGVYGREINTRNYTNEERKYINYLNKRNVKIGSPVPVPVPVPVPKPITGGPKRGVVYGGPKRGVVTGGPKMRTVYGKFKKVKTGRGPYKYNLAVAIENKGSKSNFVHATKFFGRIGDTFRISGFDGNDLKNMFITASKNVKIYVRRGRTGYAIKGPVSRKLIQRTKHVNYILVIIV